MEEDTVVLSLYRAERNQGYQELLKLQDFNGRSSTIGAFKGLHAKAILLCDWNTNEMICSTSGPHARR